MKNNIGMIRSAHLCLPAGRFSSVGDFHDLYSPSQRQLLFAIASEA